jgi:hypothetical protein
MMKKWPVASGQWPARHPDGSLPATGHRPLTTGLRGQSVVELAIALPVLLLIMLGLINLGILMNSQIILTQAAWEGARAGATLANPADGDAEIVGAVRAALAGVDASLVEIDIEPAQGEFPRDQPGPLPRGRPLAIRLEYPLSLTLPIPVTVPLRAEAVSRMEYQNP